MAVIKKWGNICNVLSRVSCLKYTFINFHTYICGIEGEQAKEKFHKILWFKNLSISQSLFNHCLLPEYCGRVVLKCLTNAFTNLYMHRLLWFKTRCKKISTSLFFKFSACCVVLFLTRGLLSHDGDRQFSLGSRNGGMIPASSAKQLHGFE